MNQVKMRKRKNSLFLIQQFTVTDFKLRYSQSILGYLWSLLNPLMMFGVLYVVFSVFMRFGNVEHYQLYLLSGIILWTFFSETTTSGMNSLLAKSGLLTKISFPKVIIPFSSLLTSALTLAINMVVFFAFVAFSGVRLQVSALGAAVIILELLLLSFSVSLILSSFYLRFRDLSHIWGVVLQIGFWATPIIYPAEIIPARFQFVVKMNPMARIIHSFRVMVIYGEAVPVRSILYTLVMAAVLFGVGALLFNRNKKYFAEWI